MFRFLCVYRCPGTVHTTGQNTTHGVRELFFVGAYRRARGSIVKFIKNNITILFIRKIIITVIIVFGAAVRCARVSDTQSNTTRPCVVRDMHQHGGDHADDGHDEPGTIVARWCA